MKLNRKFFTSIMLAISMFSLRTQANEYLTTTHQISDLNAGSSGSFPSNFTTLSNTLYFCAYTFTTGYELWKYNGASIVLASNINDTVTDLGGGLFEGNSSNPKGFTEYRERLYFSAFEPRRGAELWAYDGTNASRVADINPDANDTIKASPRNSFPYGFAVFNDVLYFSADNGGNQSDYELWRYNGTNASIVTNLNPGNNSSSFPENLTVFQNALYYSADNGSNGFELWKYNGTQNVLLDINPGGSSSSSFPKYFLPLNGALYFQAFHPSYGYELWKTDGNTVSLAADINPGTTSSFAELLTVFQESVYFRANDGINGYELWKFDGTNASMVADINSLGDSFPKNLTTFNDQLYFAAHDGSNGWELWSYDGAGALLVTNLNSAGDSFPEWLTPFEDALYFVATIPETGYELWRLREGAVGLVADINSGASNSFPQHFQIHNGQLFFSATQGGDSNYEPWTLLTAPLRVESIIPAEGGVQILWQTLGGTTNYVQASGNVSGPYTNLSEPIIISGATHTTTNFTDSEVTDEETRFYRVISP